MGRCRGERDPLWEAVAQLMAACPEEAAGQEAGQMVEATVEAGQKATVRDRKGGMRNFESLGMWWRKRKGGRIRLLAKLLARLASSVAAACFSCLTLVCLTSLIDSRGIRCDARRQVIVSTWRELRRLNLSEANRRTMIPVRLIATVGRR